MFMSALLNWEISRRGSLERHLMGIVNGNCRVKIYRHLLDLTRNRREKCNLRRVDQRSQLTGCCAWFRYNSQSALLQDLKPITSSQTRWPQAQRSFRKILKNAGKEFAFLTSLEWTFEVKTLWKCCKITSAWNYVYFILFLLVLREIFMLFIWKILSHVNKLTGSSPLVENRLYAEPTEA
jgi:hypothetical protein